MTEKKPKVSVCVVTYNQENYIRECLQSIVNQEADFDFEVIVGDDCSTDKTRQIILEFYQRYPEKIKIIFREKNIGPYENYINTHSMAKGMYVAHCDGDDFWYQGKIKSQAKFLDENIKISAVFSNAKSNTLIKYSHRECGLHRMRDILGRIFTRNICVHSSVMERRENLNSNIDVGSEIFDFELYWLKHGDALVYVNPMVLVNYSINTQGISRQKNYIKSLKKSLTRFSARGLDQDTLEKMRFDFDVMEYLSDPLNKNQPSIVTAIKRGYDIAVLSRLLVPKNIYFKIKNFKKL